MSQPFLSQTPLNRSAPKSPQSVPMHRNPCLLASQACTVKAMEILFASHKSISVQHVPYLPLPAFSSVFAMLHVDHLVVGVVIVHHVKTRTNIGGVRSHGHKLQGDLVSFGRYTVGSCENSSLPVTCVCEKLLAPLGTVFLKSLRTLSSLNVRGWQLGAPRTVLRWPHLQEQP